MAGKSRSYEKVKARYGYIFISVWFTGFVLLFLLPFINSVRYSFNEMVVNPGEVELTFAGLDNYRYIFFSDKDFLPGFTETIISVVSQTPMIIVFSLFIAIVINQNFRGRLLARAVFFLPVIISSGVVINMINNDSFLGMIMSGQRSSQMFEANSLWDLMVQMGVNQIVTDFIVNTVNQIFNLVWTSGIQILIFLAGLQAIPRSLYESASVEGSNAWISFWKITLPMISPMLMVNLLYTVIDNFISYSNPLFKTIQDMSSRLRISYASAMSMVSFLVLFALVGIVYAIFNRRVYYAVE